MERTYEIHWTESGGLLNKQEGIKHHQEAFLELERVKSRNNVVKVELFEIDVDPSLNLEVARRLLIRWEREIKPK